MTIRRRQFLTLSAAGLASASLGGLTSALGAMNARAQSQSGYRAIVSVFLYGGMDSHDTVIPYDAGAYNAWADIRQSLVNLHEGRRARSNLLPLGARDDAGRAGLALAPELPKLHGLIEAGDAAIVGNVGPLIVPTTASAFFAESLPLPSRLFSHNDQQATWMAGSPEGAVAGWAGRFADRALARFPGDDATFYAISTGGADLLATGDQVTPFRVGPEGASEPYLVTYTKGALNTALTRHFRGEGYGGNNLLTLDMKSAINASFAANSTFTTASDKVDPGDVDFPDSWLGQQLRAVANAIAIRDELGVSRQVFVAGIGGFDTHANQAGDLPNLHREIDDAIAAFHQSMVNAGLDRDVLLFTASDFGRTLAINGDGTDHGWGADHFVVGGGVAGNRIHGSIPEPGFGHDLDAGSGRLIPGTSIEQFAAPIGRWFGLNDLELLQALPRLGNFPSELALFA